MNSRLGVPFWLSLGFAFLISWSAAAQLMLLGIGGGGGGNYSGIGDVFPTGGGNTILGWWGLRAYNLANANAHSNIAIITRASDSTTCTAVSTTAGNMDLVGTPCAGSLTIPSWCNATTCSVTTLFDQSGGGHNLTQATLSRGPVLVFNCLGTLPCMSFLASSNQFVGVTGVTSQGQQNFYSGVFNRTSAFTTTGWFIGTNGTSLGFNNTANTGAIFASSTVTFTMADSAWHAASVYFNATSTIVNVDGTETGPLNGGSTGTGTQWNMGVFANTPNTPFTGNGTEMGLWHTNSAIPNVTQRAAVCHNERVYWGISGSC